MPVVLGVPGDYKTIDMSLDNRERGWGRQQNIKNKYLNRLDFSF